MAKINKTPYGENCVVVDNESRFANILRSEVKGSFQKNIISELLVNGYSTGTASLRGKARSYRGRYETSARNMIDRINKKLDAQAAPHKIRCGKVGPKGGFGYYIE